CTLAGAGRRLSGLPQTVSLFGEPVLRANHCIYDLILLLLVQHSKWFSLCCQAGPRFCVSTALTKSSHQRLLLAISCQSQNSTFKFDAAAY
ncbi:MAG: hypothetical protein ACXV2F_06400, partial [Halobacteriota archaeon]